MKPKCKKCKIEMVVSSTSKNNEGEVVTKLRCTSCGSTSKAIPQKKKKIK